MAATCTKPSRLKAPSKAAPAAKSTVVGARASAPARPSNVAEAKRPSIARARVGSEGRCVDDGAGAFDRNALSQSGCRRLMATISL